MIAEREDLILQIWAEKHGWIVLDTDKPIEWRRAFKCRGSDVIVYWFAGGWSKAEKRDGTLKPIDWNRNLIKMLS